jgi:5'-nucleotidase
LIPSAGVTEGERVAYELADRMVVGVASSALFDLTESHRVFVDDGRAAYESYQREHEEVPLRPGVAFPFIRRLLSINSLASGSGDPLVEVIVMSRNSPKTGLRVMNSVAHHGLDITRSVFTEGKSPHVYIAPLHMSLFLSASEQDVKDAVNEGLPAGRVLETGFEDDLNDLELRLAFDFDGVLADDEAERIYAESDLLSFLEHEEQKAASSLNPGPLKGFLDDVSRLQGIEMAHASTHEGYSPRIRVAVVTARNAPAHKRAINTLDGWGVTVNDAFFLGGVDKALITDTLRPHVFFDDQIRHLESTSHGTPSVHIPFGIRNAS